MENSQLFCSTCQNLMLAVYSETYKLKCINCNFEKPIENIRLYQLVDKSNTDTNTYSKFEFDENDIIFDNSLQRIFLNNNTTTDEFVCLNDKNMKKIYINTNTREIHTDNIKLQIKPSESIDINERKFASIITSEQQESKKTSKSKQSSKSKEPSSKSKEPSKSKISSKSKDATSSNVVDTQQKDILYYFSNSANKKAGSGTNETVQKAEDYKELNEIKDWRKILSNFYVEPFTYEGKRYNTVEHAFQSAKIKIADPDKLIANQFTLDSGHRIGQGDGSMARKQRKILTLTPEQLDEWNRKKDKIMKDITRERIKQSDTYRRVLLATNNAELWHIRSPQDPVHNKYLEELRDEFRQQQS